MSQSMPEDVVPLEILRVAWRVDKSIERQEGVGRIFALISELSDALEEHGFRGAAMWLRQVIEGEYANVA